MHRRPLQTFLRCGWGALRKWNSKEFESMSQFERVKKAALIYLRCGYSVIPVGNDKRPLFAWNIFQERLTTPAEINDWPECSALGIVTGTVSGLAVIDCDSMDAAKWWWQDTKRHTCWTVRTRRGVHFYFRLDDGLIIKNGVKVNGQYDVRGEGGYVVASPSVVDGHEYKMTLKEYQREKLPFFDSGWRPTQQPKPVEEKPKITNAHNYIRAIHAVEGQNGDLDTFRVACVLRDAGLSESEAMLEILDWNRTNAKPPWTDKELQRKVQCAYMKGF